MIQMGGRRYVISDPRRCPDALILHVRSVLATTGFNTIEPLPDEAPEDFLSRKADCATAAAVPFLAAMLLPEGTTEADWSPELARRMGRDLRRLHSPSARAQMHELARLCAWRLFEAAMPAGNQAPDRAGVH